MVPGTTSLRLRSVQEFFLYPESVEGFGGLIRERAKRAQFCSFIKRSPAAVRARETIKLNHVLRGLLFRRFAVVRAIVLADKTELKQRSVGAFERVSQLFFLFPIVFHGHKIVPVLLLEM